MASRNQSIENLKSKVSAAGGFAQSNLFMVSLPTGITNTNAEEMNIVCTSVTLPSRQISTQQRPFGIATTDYGYGYQSGNITMTFRVLNDQRIRDYFQAWQGTIIQNQDPNRANQSYSIGYYKDYAKTVKIHQLRKGLEFPVYKKQFDLDFPPEIKNRLPSLGPIDFAQGEIDLSLGTNDDIVYTTELFEAFPVTFQQETLSDANVNGISEINIEFAFRDFKGYKSDADKFTRNTVKAINFLGKLFNVF